MSQIYVRYKCHECDNEGIMRKKTVKGERPITDYMAGCICTGEFPTWITEGEMVKGIMIVFDERREQ